MDRRHEVFPIPNINYPIRSAAVVHREEDENPSSMPTPSVSVPIDNNSRQMDSRYRRASSLTPGNYGGINGSNSQIISQELFIQRIVNNRKLCVSKQCEGLFDRIIAFQRANIYTNTFAAAMEMFSPEPYGDALVKAVYGAKFYDYVMKYRKVDEKDDRILERRRFEQVLTDHFLVLEKEDTVDNKETYIKIITPFNVLCDEAEKMKIKCELRTDLYYDKGLYQQKRASAKNLAAQLLRLRRDEGEVLSAFFKKTKLSLFKGGDADVMGLGEVQNTFFSSSKRILLTYNLITNLKMTSARKNRQIGILVLLREGIITEFYPLHDGPSNINSGEFINERASLNENWAKLKNLLRRQPLDEISNYFGERVSFYFGFIGFYTIMLLVAAVVGVWAFVYGISKFNLSTSQNYFQSLSEIFDNDVTIMYTLFMSVWATVFLEYFKRYSIKLAYRWDVIGYEKEEIQRSRYSPKSYRLSPVTGKWERYETAFSRKSKLFISACILATCIAIVIGTVVMMIFVRIYLGPGNVILSSTISLVIILILGYLYQFIATSLTDWENHRTETEYENAKIAKQFLFDFVNYYSPLLYIGLVKNVLIEEIPGWQDKCTNIGDETDPRYSCMIDLTTQLVIIFVGKQVFNQFLEMGYPWVIRLWQRLANQSRTTNEKEELTLEKRRKQELEKSKLAAQHVKDDILVKYYGMTDEYNEMAIQFGFVMLFVTSFPLGALFAFLNNAFEIRFDAKKLIEEYQRPVPFSAANIGIWFRILEIVSYISVLTNATLIALTSDNFSKTWLAGYSGMSRRYVQLLFIIGFEHLVFSLKYMISFMIPDVPGRIKNALRREEYMAKVNIEGQPPEEDDPEAIAMRDKDLAAGKKVAGYVQD